MINMGDYTRIIPRARHCKSWLKYEDIYWNCRTIEQMLERDYKQRLKEIESRNTKK